MATTNMLLHAIFKVTMVTYFTKTIIF